MPPYALRAAAMLARALFDTMLRRLPLPCYTCCPRAFVDTHTLRCRDATRDDIALRHTPLLLVTAHRMFGARNTVGYESTTGG